VVRVRVSQVFMTNILVKRFYVDMLREDREKSDD
jgi:hypothetical protein